jgi:hypothetical protein
VPLDIDPNSPTPLAIEFAAHQRVRLGDYGGGSEDFGRLLNLAANENRPTARARALRFQAEIVEFGNGVQPNVNSATQLLNAAIDLLPPQRTHADVLDAAELHEMQRRVRSKRQNADWDSSALKSFTTAEGLYLQIKTPEAATALDRIAGERRKILGRQGSPPNGGTDATVAVN